MRSYCDENTVVRKSRSNIIKLFPVRLIEITGVSSGQIKAVACKRYLNYSVLPHNGRKPDIVLDKKMEIKIRTIRKL